MDDPLSEELRFEYSVTVRCSRSHIRSNVKRSSLVRALASVRLWIVAVWRWITALFGD